MRQAAAIALGQTGHAKVTTNIKKILYHISWSCTVIHFTTVPCIHIISMYTCMYILADDTQ